VPAFRVKLSANDLNCVDVPLNPSHLLTLSRWWGCVKEYMRSVDLLCEDAQVEKEN